MRVKYPEFGERLKKQRISKGLKQKDCLKDLGDITIQMLSNWENGYTFPSATYLRKISSFYNVSLDYLVLGNTKNEKLMRIDSYSQLLEIIVKLIESGKFDSNITKVENNLIRFSLSTNDKKVMEFVSDYEKLAESKELYGNIAFEEALIKLIKKNKDLL